MFSWILFVWVCFFPLLWSAVFTKGMCVSISSGSSATRSKYTLLTPAKLRRVCPHYLACLRIHTLTVVMTQAALLICLPAGGRRADVSYQRDQEGLKTPIQHLYTDIFLRWPHGSCYYTFKWQKQKRKKKKKQQFIYVVFVLRFDNEGIFFLQSLHHRQAAVARRR